MKFKIEWNSHFNPDGSRKARLPVNSLHGWLAKWRGTFSGNERLRSRGMREIHQAKTEAKVKREYEREKKRRTQPSGFFSAFFGPPPRKPSSRPSHSTRRHSSVAPPSRRSSHYSSYPTPHSRPISRKVSSHRLVGQPAVRASHNSSIRRSSTQPVLPSSAHRRSTARGGPPSARAPQYSRRRTTR